MSRGTVHPRGVADRKEREGIGTDTLRDCPQLLDALAHLGQKRRSRGTCRGGLSAIHSGAIWPLPLVRVVQLTRKPPMRSQPESGVRTLSAAFRTPPAPTVHSPLLCLFLSLSLSVSVSLSASHTHISSFLATILSASFSVTSACTKSSLLNTHPSYPPPWTLTLTPSTSLASLTPHSSSTLRLTQTQHTQRNATQLLSHLYLRTLARYLTDTAGVRYVRSSAPINSPGGPLPNRTLLSARYQPFQHPHPPIPSLPSRHRTSLAF